MIEIGRKGNKKWYDNPLTVLIIGLSIVGGFGYIVSTMSAGGISGEDQPITVNVPGNTAPTLDLKLSDEIKPGTGITGAGVFFNFGNRYDTSAEYQDSSLDRAGSDYVALVNATSSYYGRLMKGTFNEGSIIELRTSMAKFGAPTLTVYDEDNDASTNSNNVSMAADGDAHTFSLKVKAPTDDFTSNPFIDVGETGEDVMVNELDKNNGHVLTGGYVVTLNSTDSNYDWSNVDMPGCERTILSVNDTDWDTDARFLCEGVPFDNGKLVEDVYIEASGDIALYADIRVDDVDLFLNGETGDVEFGCADEDGNDLGQSYVTSRIYIE